MWESSSLLLLFSIYSFESVAAPPTSGCFFMCSGWMCSRKPRVASDVSYIRTAGILSASVQENNIQITPSCPAPHHGCHLSAEFFLQRMFAPVRKNNPAVLLSPQMLVIVNPVAAFLFPLVGQILSTCCGQLQMVILAFPNGRSDCTNVFHVCSVTAALREIKPRLP